VELIGTTYIQASSGYYASIEYSSRGWISGQKNHFKCLIRKNEAGPKDYLYKIEGQWSGSSTITNYKTKVSNPFLDVNILKAATTKIKPLEKMGDMETRRIWQKVSEAIRNNDTVLAGQEKSIIENQKRAEKKKREELGVNWKPVYFKWVPEESKITKLQKTLSQVIKCKSEATAATSQNGNWVFKEESKTIFNSRKS
jgi:hypothetical protein